MISAFGLEIATTDSNSINTQSNISANSFQMKNLNNEDKNITILVAVTLTSINPGSVSVATQKLSKYTPIFPKLTALISSITQACSMHSRLCSKLQKSTFFNLSNNVKANLLKAVISYTLHTFNWVTVANILKNILKL